MELTLQKKLKNNIFLDYISIFIENLNMQSSIWVLYLAYCGMNLGQIGILEGIYHITSMIFEIPSGAIADLLGRKKSMILSRICIAISCVIMLFCKSFWFFALSFVIQALGNNFLSGSEEALVYDSMKAIGQQDKYMGVSGKDNFLIELSQGIATVLGGVLAEYSYFFCYAACLVIALCAFIPVIFMTEAPFEKTASIEGSIFVKLINHFATSFKVLKEDKRILIIVIFYEGIFTAQTLLFFYSQQYFFDLGHNKIVISIFMLFGGIVSCIGSLLSEKIYSRYGNKISIISSITIAACLIAYIFNNTIISVVGFVISQFCSALLYPIESASLNSLISSEQRATLISVKSMIFSIAMILLFPISGFVADKIGLSMVFFVIGFILIVFTLLWRKKIKR